MADDIGNFRIAGDKTVECWRKRHAELEDGGTLDLWEKTADEFLMQRLKTRYLKPIEKIKKDGALEGEGFAIVTIQCALIEFLASLQKGENYRHLKKGEELKEFEYNRSRNLFVEFLKSDNSPVVDCFGECETPKKCDNCDKCKEAGDFYSNVRCALLHEARTLGGWRILANDGKAIDPASRSINRTALQTGIEDWLKRYCDLLKSDEKTQERFLRKFDHLAGISTPPKA